MKTPLRLTLLAFAVVAALTGPAAAPAVEIPNPPPGESAIEQYVETLPTGEGGAAVGTGGAARTTLPPGIRTRIRRELGRLERSARGGGAASLTADAEAQLLEQIATSAAYGAPQTILRPKGARSGSSPGGGRVFDRGDVRRGVSTQQALTTAVEAAADVSDARVAGLFAVLALISASALATAASRRRSPVR